MNNEQKRVHFIFCNSGTENQDTDATQFSTRHEKYDVSMLLDEQVTDDHYCTQINEYLLT